MTNPDLENPKPTRGEPMAATASECKCDKYRQALLSLLEDSPKYKKIIELVGKANDLLSEAHGLMCRMGIDEEVADSDWPLLLGDALNCSGEVLLEIDPENQDLNHEPRH